MGYLYSDSRYIGDRALQRLVTRGAGHQRVRPAAPPRQNAVAGRGAYCRLVETQIQMADSADTAVRHRDGGTGRLCALPRRHHQRGTPQHHAVRDSDTACRAA